MTNESLTKERNTFLLGFVGLIAIAQVGGWAITNAGDRESALALGLGAKVILMYLVFRLSRFLAQPWWQTFVYCVLTPFALVYAIPFVALLVGVRNARRRLLISVNDSDLPAPGSP